MRYELPDMPDYSTMCPGSYPHRRATNPAYDVFEDDHGVWATPRTPENGGSVPENAGKHPTETVMDNVMAALAVLDTDTTDEEFRTAMWGYIHAKAAFMLTDRRIHGDSLPHAIVHRGVVHHGGFTDTRWLARRQIAETLEPIDLKTKKLLHKEALTATITAMHPLRQDEMPHHHGPTVKNLLHEPLPHERNHS